MSAEDLPPPPSTVPESVLKKRKRDDQWALSRKQRANESKLRGIANKKFVFKRAEEFVMEYRKQEEDFIRLKRLSRVKSKARVDPDARLLFAVRVGGINDIHPKTRKIFQRLRLQQMHNGVFLKANETNVDMLRKVEPYVIYGCPNLKTVKELVYKRGFGKVKKQKLPLTDNAMIEQALGKFGIICIEDLIHQIHSVGPHFKEANDFLWPFKLSAPQGGLKKKKNDDSIESGDAGDNEVDVNTLIRRMI